MPQQSTSDLRGTAQSALAASPIAALHALRVEHVGQTLLLSGAVTSFYHKQLAQELVRVAVGQVELINSIDVC